MSRRPRTRKPIATHKPLDARQLRFVDEYLVDLCGAAAARRAGYSAKDSRKRAQILLDREDVQALLTEKMQARAERVQIEADAVLEHLAAIATSDIGDVLDFTGDEVRLRAPKDIPAHARRAIASVKVQRRIVKTVTGPEPVEVIEFKLWDKPGSIRSAMQHLGLLVEKHEHTGKDGAPLTFTLALGDAHVRDSDGD